MLRAVDFVDCAVRTAFVFGDANGNIVRKLYP